MKEKSEVKRCEKNLKKISILFPFDIKELEYTHGFSVKAKTNNVYSDGKITITVFFDNGSANTAIAFLCILTLVVGVFTVSGDDGKINAKKFYGVKAVPAVIKSDTFPIWKYLLKAES